MRHRLGDCQNLFEIDLAKLLSRFTSSRWSDLFLDREFVNVAWDSATTGPVTVPLVLAMGWARQCRVGVEGFGILSMASIGPIIAVLSMGLFIRFRQSRVVAANAK